MLENLDITLQQIDLSFDNTSEPMMWRLIPIWENYDCVFLRDIDSIPNRQEYNSTKYFETKDYAIQTLRSHENHYHEIPVPLMLTDDSYLNEITLDCSLSSGSTIKMPSKFIVNGMKLKQLFVDGRFFDGKNNLIASPVSIWKDSKLSGVLIRKDSLIEFLQANHCKIFWIFLAEKNVLPPTFGNKGQFFRREISGLYLLNKVDRVHGRFTFVKDNKR